MTITLSFSTANQAVNSATLLKELFNNEASTTNTVELPTFAQWWNCLKLNNQLRVKTIGGITGVRLMDYIKTVAPIIGNPYIKKGDKLINPQEHYVKLSTIRALAIKKGLCC